MFNVHPSLHPRIYTYEVYLDNYIPPRSVNHGQLVVFDSISDKTFNNVQVIKSDFPGDAEKAVYLIDYGNFVLSYYVAGFNNAEDTVILHPFPVSPKRDQFNSWQLGPRKAYHIKIKDING